MSGYEVSHLDELEQLPVDDEGLVWRPIRRRFGIAAFGTNAYSAARAGDRVVESHTERMNEHEEMYVVVTGRARFTLGDEELDAPAGTLVFIRDPGVRRGATAVEDGTTVLAVGARPGYAFEPSAWEDSFVAGAYGRLGRIDEGLAIMRAAVERHPDAWQGYYNLACLESLAGRRDEALASLERAYELEPEDVARIAADDAELDAIRDDPRFPSAHSTA
ncbi:MAG: TPR end-of-group domain-containing protein [Gaiellaceae bacterium]